jgi:hypothetical protein
VNSFQLLCIRREARTTRELIELESMESEENGKLLHIMLILAPVGYLALSNLHPTRISRGSAIDVEHTMRKVVS